MTTVQIIGVIGCLFLAGFVIICLKVWWGITKITWKVIRWPLGLIAIISIGWFGYKYYSDGQTQEQVIRQRVAQEMAKKEASKPATEKAWEYVLETPPGATGINPGQQLVKGEAIIIEDNDKVLVFRVYFDHLDKTKTTELYLDRDKAEGVWNQRIPASEGHWQLNKVQTVKGGYCLKVNRSETPNIWANAFLIPK